MAAAMILPEKDSIALISTVQGKTLRREVHLHGCAKEDACFTSRISDWAARVSKQSVVIAMDNMFQNKVSVFQGTCTNKLLIHVFPHSLKNFEFFFFYQY